LGHFEVPRNLASSICPLGHRPPLRSLIVPFSYWCNVAKLHVSNLTLGHGPELNQNTPYKSRYQNEGLIQGTGPQMKPCCCCCTSPRVMMTTCHYLTGGTPSLFVDDEIPGGEKKLWMIT
jgi:hypothetical protein